MYICNIFFFILSRTLNFIFYYVSFLFWCSEKKEHNINISFLKNYYFKLQQKRKKINIIITDKLRCCTWNIHYGYDAKGRYVFPHVVNYLKEMDFDIIFLQEMNNHIYKINNEDITLSDYLGNILNMKNATNNELTILSKFPITNIKLNTYITTNNSFGNRILRCKIHYSKNKAITCINTHLNNDFTGYEQIEAIQSLGIDKFILSHKKNNKKLLLGGDFNSPRFFYVNTYLSQLFNQIDKNNIITFPTYYPLVNLDKVWLNESNTEQSLHHLCSDDSNYCSDHRPVLFEIKLNHSISVPALSS